ncbi:MAG TPA: phosphatidate cytidylyltransferase [Elusimicrobia bacterium]|nr:phosphatidate cytidylyltransferase [Elusimicrobiota bacterium]HBT61695.1 phosphatidate cytidylyltransferase [Elusimicrobiota bacterium]
MLLPRLMTAALGIPLVLLLIHCGGLAWAAFVVAVCGLCVFEYGQALVAGGRPVQRVVLLACGAALAMSVALAGPGEAILTAAVAAIVLREMFGRVRSLERLSFTLFGALFLGWLPAHLALVRELRPDGEKLTYILFSAVWLMDSAAYAAGKTLGRRKLAEGLSPKKTWEGATAGLLCAVGGVVLMARLLGLETLGWRGAAALGVIIGVCGQLSDLAESMIKRAVGLKDSGNLLPGHGGVMDRFDSFILAAPAAYYFLVMK